MPTAHPTDTRSDVQRLHDECSELHDRIDKLLDQILPHAIYPRREVVLAMQDAQAHLAAAEQLLRMARNGGGAS